jgi:adenine-specific DNA-methyltransferase
LEINDAMSQTRRKLLENFDDEVREKLKVSDETSKAFLNRYERLLMQLTRHELNSHAEFRDDSSFVLKAVPESLRLLRLFAADSIPLGLYELPRRSGEAHLYRLAHPLAEAVITQAKNRDLATAEVHFDYGAHDGKVTLLKPLIGKAGWLKVSLFTVESLDQAEDNLIFAASSDDGQVLDEEAGQRLLTLPGRVLDSGSSRREEAPAYFLKIDRSLVTSADTTQLEAITQNRQAAIQRTISERNARFFEAEADKLEGWADDLKLGLEREIKELDRQIKEARRAATIALTLEEKLAGQKQIKALEAQRSQRRRSLFDAQDQVDKQREDLIANIEGKLTQKSSLSKLFTLRWRLD